LSNAARQRLACAPITLRHPAPPCAVPSHIEPVSGMPKRKLENGEGRLAPQSHQSRAESPEFAGQRLGRASLTRRNVDSSREAGNRIGETATGWLGWEDSNSQMSLPKLAFEVWPEFPFISQRLAIRDFSRLSCQRVTCTPVQSISAMNMARRSPLRRGQAMLERRLLWIREFESSHPSQCGLCGVLP
jgi:hypothetical protein